MTTVLRRALLFFSGQWSLKIYYKGLHRFDLIIYDDLYPNKISGFRYEEINYMLNYFSNSKILISIQDSKLKSKYENPEQIIKSSRTTKINSFSGNPKIKEYKNLMNINTKLFYCIFLNNIFKNIQWLERNNINFVFTLYPGGGFFLNNCVSDAKLRMVLCSKNLLKVIVTQNISYEYLINKQFCDTNKIQIILGGVVPQNSFHLNPTNKFDFIECNFCFCGARNSSLGEDKGYNIFVDVMIMLMESGSNVFAHIIGGFQQDSYPLSGFEDRFQFYGYIEFDELCHVFQKCQIILSPNKSDILTNGSFDGFPTGCVVEAVLNGCLAIVCDDLFQNSLYLNYQDLIIINCKSEEIYLVIKRLLNDRTMMSNIARSGNRRFKEVYSNARQLSPRINLIESYINND